MSDPELVRTAESTGDSEGDTTHNPDLAVENENARLKAETANYKFLAAKAAHDEKLLDPGKTWYGRKKKSQPVQQTEAGAQVAPASVQPQSKSKAQPKQDIENSRPSTSQMAVILSFTLIILVGMWWLLKDVELEIIDLPSGQAVSTPITREVEE